ncbi:hypothetical protein SY83_07325 [Paenibacillus swuensis]|uniref:HTH gntR-type domain-containing protein n=1 Tax=Paenibacillus swuensis TaxID=1178515 RepID=A0A172TGH7_9BACL|nr:PLP-dependent aminotransferase family protein [Paenibacillus swuensis]ANE46120.1 hypothetical protein SY83_07325 [Paenibacillus swuensis]
MDIQLVLYPYEQEHRFKYLALYHALRDAILGGTVIYGDKLPSTRQLAEQYGVSRGSVNEAYGMLIAEGYLDAVEGSGTYVAFKTDRGDRIPQDDRGRVRLSAWGERVEGIGMRRANRVKQAAPLSFAMGVPDLSLFPLAEWTRLISAETRKLARVPRGDAWEAQGHRPLREAIALYLRRARGIAADPDDIVVFGGSMQALALLAQLLLDSGEPAVLESPGYPGADLAVRSAGGVPVYARVDEQGLVPEDWPARMLIATPSRQFPTGRVLSLERRQSLLAWAERHGSVIVEDDYDSEFRWGGRPIEPLKALDRAGRVVYVGTFTKTMLPDLRIGYALLPRRLTGAAAAAKALYEPHPTAVLEQRALAAFMRSGAYERHLRRMTRLYGRKAKALAALLQSHLADAFEIIPSDAGMHIFGWWRGSASLYNEYRYTCFASGVSWTDGTGYDLADRRPSACFGFSHLSEEEWVRGVRIMHEVWLNLD